MASRRQQKLARVIRDSVSNTITKRLSDPRITGLISVTEVNISPDAKNATVCLSIFATDEEAAQKTFAAIQHAAGPIQAALGRDLPGHSCPRLRFELDTKMKKTLEVLNLIDQASREYRKDDQAAEEEWPEGTAPDADAEDDRDLDEDAEQAGGDMR